MFIVPLHWSRVNGANEEVVHEGLGSLGAG